MESRTFRQASCAMIAGGLIALVGAVISGVGGYHLATGKPLMQAGSKLSSGEHVASGSELWFAILGGLPLLLFGLAIVLTGMNSAITIDEEGISATNLFRRQIFHATWAEITALDRIDSSAASGYRLKVNGNTLSIQTSTAGMKDLVAEIRKRAQL